MTDAERALEEALITQVSNVYELAHELQEFHHIPAGLMTAIRRLGDASNALIIHRVRTAGLFPQAFPPIAPTPEG